MGRPHKDGVDYWNIDVDFFQDKKIRLIRGEFGVKGVYITILLLNEIYRTGGYYKKWDDDDCLLMSDSSGVAGDCSPELIAEVVQGLLRRSFFDRGVFERFHVLTSDGIQRRFLHMVGNSRESIHIIQEYFLLNTSDLKDVTEATLKKIVLFPVSSQENAVSGKENHATFKENAIKDRKEEDRTGKDRKEEQAGPPPFADYPVLQSAFDAWLQYKKERRESYKPTGLQRLISQIRKNVELYGPEAVAELIDECMASNWQGIIFDRLRRRNPARNQQYQGGHSSAPDGGQNPGGRGKFADRLARRKAEGKI